MHRYRSRVPSPSGTGAVADLGFGQHHVKCRISFTRLLPANYCYHAYTLQVIFFKLAHRVGGRVSHAPVPVSHRYPVGGSEQQPI